MPDIDLTELADGHAYFLNPQDQERVRRCNERVLAHPHETLEDFIVESTFAGFGYPPALVEAVLSFKRWGTKEGVLLLRGLPTDAQLPATPVDSKRSAQKGSFVSETCLAAIAALLGEPIAYAQEKNGELFQDVCPTMANAAQWSSESSEVLLPFHTEVAFHPYLPSYVLLYCLRGDRAGAAKTLVSSIGNVYDLLTPELVDELSRPVYETGIDYSFGAANMTRGGGRVVPVISGSSHDPLICFDPGLMTAPPGGARAVEQLEETCNEVARSVVLQPGDLLVIDNRRAVHARTKYEALFDGRDRWLQRVFVVDSLTSSTAYRQQRSRVINVVF